MHAPKRFKLKRASYLVMGAVAMLSAAQFAQAGAGFADNTDKAGVPFKQPTFYANSPAGTLAAHGPLGPNGAIIPGVSEGSTRDTGTALRKFVDNLPMVDGYVTNPALLTANAPGGPGRHIPTAVKEDVGAALLAGKVLPAAAHSVSFPDADYYEIAVVEYREQLHTDLPPVVISTNAVTGGPITTGGTTLRGYVQIWTPNLPASVLKTQLWRLDGTPVLDNQGQPVFIVGDKPHYLGPVISSTSGVPVRLKFDNYLPVGHYDPITKTRGGDSFIPTDTTVPGSGLGPLGAVDPNAPQPFERYTQNRTNIHLHGGDTPWISDGQPHDWITPAGENTPYKVGETTQNVPDMPDPGAGSQTLYYPNNQSARMMWYHDHSYGSTRIDVYAGIVSAFMIHDATEAAMTTPGGGKVVRTNPDGTTTNFTLQGALAGMDEIPLVFEDKTFVPKDVAVEDSKWNTDTWGKYGDLWFPHVYESNQNPNSIDGTNPAGRWDYGPWFWPVFPAPLALPTGEYGNVSATQESFSDTPLINGIAYPNLTVEPKPYRFRLLNASLQRYLNVGFWVAEPLSLAMSANGSNYSQATTATVTADDNGNIPTVSLQISPIAAPTVTMLTGGALYSATPTVTFVPSGADATNAALVNATGHAVVVGGVIQGIIVDTAGTGYTVAPTISIVDASGAGATTSVSLNAGGQIMAIKVNLVPPAGSTFKAYSYTAKGAPTVTITDPTGQGTGATVVASVNTEVPMVDAVMPAVNPAYAANTYDGRPGGIPDPAAMGPNTILIGNEGGWLAQPNVITPTPVSYQQLRRIVTVLNILDHGLYVGPAERADFVVDFSQFAGKTLIWYNDCPAPNPGFDARVDYYTGDPDQTGAGGADVTLPGLGPNTRTIMRVNVSPTMFPTAAGTTPAIPAAFDPLNNGGPLAADLPKAFAASQEVPIVPESWQNSAYGTAYTDNTAHIYAGSYQQPTLTFNVGGTPQTISGFRMDSQGAGYTIAPTVVLTGGVDLSVPGNAAATAHAVLDVAGKRIVGVALDSPGVGYTNAPIVTLNGGDGLGASATAITDATQSVFVQPKGIQELFEPNYGRMNATFSVELPFTSVLTQTTIPVGYIDPPTDQIGDGETQFWKVTHNGVDTHVVHFHLFNVQVINRVAWDGTIVALDPAEFGWKETVKMNPLEDIYVAVKPKSPKQPFGVPQSIRALDPTQPIGASQGFSQVDPKTGLATTVTNQMFNFDWEYVWHCHILGHEENDFMRVIMFNFGTEQPAAVSNVTYNPATQTVTWTDPTPATIADPLTGVISINPATYASKANEQGFLVQRSEDNGATWPDLPATTPQSAAQATNNPAGYLPNVVAANATSWVDPLPAGVNTVYRVLGFNSAGYSPNFVATQVGSGAVGVKAPVVLVNANGTPNAPSHLTAAVQPFTPANGGYPIQLNWTASPAPAGGFRIVREGGFTANGVAVPAITFNVPFSAGPAYTFTDTTSAEISAYTYNVYANNGTLAAPVLSPGSIVQVATQYGLPPVVSNVTNKIDPSGNNVAIKWSMPAATTPDAVNVTATPHVTAFNVVRTDAAGVKTTFAVQQVINPLSGTITLPDTTYVDVQPVSGTSTYTVFAVNGDQTSTTVGATSTTTVTLAAGAAPGMQGAVAIANSPTQVTINWAPAPAGTVVTGVAITRTNGATVVPLAIPAGTGIITSFVDTTAAQSTSYTYTVNWLNGASAGTPQTTATVTTPAAASLPVTGLGVTPLQSGVGANPTFTNTLSWTAGGPATSYVISRAVGASAVFTQIASGVVGTTYADTTAAAGTVYTYAVQAINGNNAPSTPVTVSVYDAFAPVAPATVTGSAVLGTVTVNWAASATTTATAYVVQRSTDNVNFADYATVQAPVTTISDTALSVGTTYYYRVYAQTVVAGQATMTGTPSTSAKVVYSTPAAPVIANSIPTFGGTALAPTVSFTFAAGAANGAPVTTGYQVFRDGVLYATPAAAGSYTDAAPGANTTHTYQVYAVNVLGLSAVSAATVSAQTVVQNAPTAVSAAMVTGTTTRASFVWSPSIIANAPALTGYSLTIYTNGKAATPIAIPAGTTSYTATGLASGNTYSFTVTTSNLMGASTSSGQLYVIDGLPVAPPSASNTIATGAVTLNWVASVSGSTTAYNVLRSDNGAAAVALATVAAPTLTYVDATVVAGHTYQYQIQSVASAPNVATVTSSGARTTTAAYVVPNRPATPNATSLRAPLATTDSVTVTNITGTSPANAGAITGYLVEVATTLNFATNLQSATLTPAQAAAGKTFTGVPRAVPGLLNGGPAYVRVTAINAVGNSVVSNTRTITLQ